MAKKDEQATGGRGKQRQQKPVKQADDKPSTRTGGRGKQREQ